MDESGKKINLGNFFGRSSSLDKLSSAAFSKSNPISANILEIEKKKTAKGVHFTQLNSPSNTRSL